MKTLLHACLFSLSIAIAPLSFATIVQFQTSVGDFEINLFDQQTPETVDNFLEYVADGRYENVIFHRLVERFVLQGGGFTLSEGKLSAVERFASVDNEPVFSNVRGTIAMAKIGGQPDSATSQWFINLVDNSRNLDVSNGGFTVFGQVTGSGVAVVDFLASFSIYDFEGALTELPLQDYTADDNSVAPLAENYALIYNVVVLDAAEDTAAALSPVKNTLLDDQSSSGGDSDSGGGGNASWLLLLALLGASVFRRIKKSVKV